MNLAEIRGLEQLFQALGVQPGIALATQRVLGGTAELTTASGVHPVGIIQPQAPLCQAATDVTVTFGLELPGENPKFHHDHAVVKNCHVLADIRFGHGACSFIAEVDVKQGSQVTFPASTASVAIRWAEAPYQVDDGGTLYWATPELVRVSAVLALGSRAARSYPTRTYPKTSIGAGLGATFAVPPFGHGLHLFSDDETFFTSGLVDVGYLGGPAIYYGDLLSVMPASVFGSARVTDSGVVLPNSTQFVSITNNGSAAVNVTPVFALSF